MTVINTEEVTCKYIIEIPLVRPTPLSPPGVDVERLRPVQAARRLLVELEVLGPRLEVSLAGRGPGAHPVPPLAFHEQALLARPVHHDVVRSADVGRAHHLAPKIVTAVSDGEELRS